jgi:Xaa-Pro aminopeptidase
MAMEAAAASEMAMAAATRRLKQPGVGAERELGAMVSSRKTKAKMEVLKIRT